MLCHHSVGYNVDNDPNAEEVRVKIPLQNMTDQKAIISQDLGFCTSLLDGDEMKILLPQLFSIRISFNCPDCNTESGNPSVLGEWTAGCPNCQGSNHKLLGGYAGVVTAMAFAMEWQKEATPHAHGAVTLSNLSSHNTLYQISDTVDGQH